MKSNQIVETSGKLPLVSYVLLTYNQENYIERAMKSALEQDYGNLEIIVSDDCSSDNTWAIVENLAESDTSRHRVILNQNSENKGLPGHIRHIAGQANADILILAAGDDVAKPQRASRLVQEFERSPKVMAAFSSFESISANGMPDGRDFKWDGDKSVSLDRIVRGGGGVGLGATYAYRKQCFYWPEQYPDWIDCEDRVLPLRAACLGEVRYIDTSLVYYRRAQDSLSRQIETRGKTLPRNPAHWEMVTSHLDQAFSAGLLDGHECTRLKRISKRLTSRAIHVRQAYSVERLPLIGRFLARVYRSIFLRIYRKPL